MVLFAPAAIAADGAVSRVADATATTHGRGGDNATRTNVSRTTVVRNTGNDAGGDNSAPDVISRVATRGAESGTSSGRGNNVSGRGNNSARTTIAVGAARVGATSDGAATTTRGVRSGATDDTIGARRTTITARPSAADIGSRIRTTKDDNVSGRGARNTNSARTGSDDRSVSVRAAATRETIEEAKTRLEQTADLNKSCQQQYNDCMDQFCAVIDANQKRCSCSANLSKYTKVENAVKDANTQLNEVAQRIRYVGLSADEIRAIMSATEAEEALTGATDNTETRNMLDEIEKLIKDPKSSTSYSADTYSGLDMDLDFTADDGDLFNLDFLNTSSGSFSNLRGTELYNAAKKRCNTILTQCKEVGATSQQITGNYDLAIDKDCIAYEQGLNKMNETLVSNVRSATRMLQKARLAVLQNKNQYDAKGCIAALDACMTDDMVCGADYTKCLDPTKRYIDENGKVVLGQDITDITDFMDNFNNAGIDGAFVKSAYSSQKLIPEQCSATAEDGKTGGNDGSCIVKYLMQKIGTKQKITDEGLCRAVLDKCQNYTYDSNGNYKMDNDVVVNYIQRAMVNIKAAQHKIISDYASSCMVDIATCYNQQVTQVNAWSSAASVNSVYNVMRGACRNVALTCAYAVFDKDETSCPTTATGHNDDTCINSISEMFYQSLLCPDNSSYQSTTGTIGQNGYVNERCKCNTGYEVFGSQCLLACQSNSTRNNYGQCVCNAGYTMKNNICVANSTTGGGGTPSGGGGTSSGGNNPSGGDGDNTGGGSGTNPGDITAETCTLIGGCRLADGTCTKSGMCACNGSHTTDENCTIRSEVASFKGTVADCDKRMPPQKTIDDIKKISGESFSYVATLFRTSAETSWVPGSCVIKLKDANGLCYAMNSTTSYANAPLDADGISTCDSYYFGPNWELIDCGATFASTFNHLTINQNNGPAFPVGGKSASELTVSINKGKLTSITDMLKLMKAPSGCTFGGVFENADGTGTMYHDSTGMAVPTVVLSETEPKLYKGYMVWKCN